MMKKPILSAVVALVGVGLPLLRSEASEWPFAILRSYGSYVRNSVFIDRVFAAQERHPGLFDEIWFSGCGDDPFATPAAAGRAAAEENLGARERCRALGIAFSYQQGVTLNHEPDGLRRASIPEDAWAVDREGVRQYGLLCANSTFARDFSREKAKAIMAALKPDSYWPDDDLRMTKLDWSAPSLCYCTNCLSLFGRKTGRDWTRTSLVAALTGPDASAEVRRQWCAFNGESLGGYARVYREAADAVSPSTRLGIQGALTASALEGEAYRHVIRALAGAQGKAGIRPGFGYYDDQQPRQLLKKMTHVAREAARSSRLPETAQVCYESENWPHVGAHKNPHGQMAECALALAMGCDSLAFYWGADQNGEDAAGDGFWFDAVAAWRPFHLAVRDAFAGTRLGGVSSYFGENRYGVENWTGLSESELVRLSGNGLPVTVPEAEPDAFLVTDLTVRTLSATDLPRLFAQATLMEPRTLTALAEKFPSLRFPGKVKIASLPSEKGEATVIRANGYEKFPSGRLSDKLQAFVYPQSDDVLRFSEMTNDPKAVGTCVIPTEFGGRVVLVQDANGSFPHLAWPGGRRHAVLDALDAAVPGGMPARLLTDGFATSVSVRKTADGRTAGVFVLNLGMGETPPLELAIRNGATASWRTVRPRLPDEPASVVRTAANETVVRLPPLPAFGVALVAGGARNPEDVDIDRLCPPRPETAAKFDPEAYPGPARSYGEAAKMVYGYMTSLPGMTALVETGKPHQKYQHNAYVSKTHAAHVLAMLRWAKLEPEKSETAMKFAKASAEFLLGELEPANATLAFWPPTYGRKPLEYDPKTDGPYRKCSMIGNEPEAAVKYRGEVMLVYPSDVGTAFAAYYEATKDARFLTAAKGIAETYLKTRRSDGGWPLKMRLATGEAVSENTLVPNHLLTFLEKLYAVTGEAKWRTAADEVFAWIEEHPLKDWNWDGQFEDIKPEKPYLNPTKHNACDVMMYMLDRFPGNPERLALCRRLLEFCEKRFVVWKAPENHPTWPVPSVLEQYSCFTPIDSSAAKMIRAYVAMYRAEGRAEDLAKARALADSVTRMQFPSGRVPTMWDIQTQLSGERYDWLNCMAASADALLTVAEACPKEEPGALRLGAPFADGCVLQRDRPVTIWGRAEPDVRVTVVFAGQSVVATADAKGAWRVKLAPMPACKEGRPLAVSTSASRIRLADVLVGEVWLCSGQSNADCPVWGDNPRYRDGLGALTVEMSWKPTVRFVKVPRVAATEPKLDHETVWLKMTPNDLARARNGILPSAMGTYFALELANALDVPIGLVDCSWGGTNIDAWTPRSGYDARPELADVAAYPLLDEASFGVAKTNGFYRGKPFTNGWEQQPSAIWNGMVAAYAPMTCRGMIWYQGCHNAAEYARYASKMHALYDGWAKAFENPDLSLHFAQLAPWGEPIIPRIQMAQAQFAREEPHATMAVINDVGNLQDVHPNDKRTVAKRLAVQALRVDYGWAWLKYLSPTPEGLAVDGDRVTLSFNDAEAFHLYNPAFGDRSSGFEIAGGDGVFHPAEIVNLSLFTNVVTKKVSFLGHVDGDRLVIRSPKVSEPKHVRYLHSYPWYGAVRNEVGLPLGAFAADVESLTDGERLVRDFAGLRDREFICLTNGTYHITEAMAKKMVLAPSNNQTGEKLVAFALGGRDGVMLDGGGSTLVIHGRVFPFAVTNCSRFTVRNLTITTAQPSCVGFTVEAADDEGFAVAFDEGICPYRVEDGHLVFTLDGHDVSTRDGRLSLHALDRLAIHYLMVPDSPGDRGTFPSTFVSAKATDLGGGRIRFRYAGEAHPKRVRLPYAVGEKVVVNLEEKRYRDVFFFEDCKNVAVENVTIRRFGGMGVVAQRCRDVKVDALVAEPPEGERVSLTADVMQFVNCCGDVKVERCRCGHSLDDVINIHGNYLAVESVKDRTVELRTKHASHAGFFPYRAGDALEFVAAHTRRTLAKARVVSVRPDPTDLTLCRVAVDADLPALPSETLVENVTLNPDVTIRDNDFHDHPNLRLSGRGRIRVEGNRISRSASALVGTDLADYWYESGRIFDMTIRDNDFIDCNRLGGNAFLEFGVSGWGADAPKIHGSVKIENNRFEGVKADRWRASGVRELKTDGNR